MVSELARALLSVDTCGLAVLAVPAFPAPAEKVPLVLLGAASELLAAVLEEILICCARF